MKKLLITALLFLVGVVSVPQVEATFTHRVDECSETFTYQNQANDSRVFIDTFNTGASGNPDSITVTAKTGYKVNSVKLELDDNNTFGWDVELGEGDVLSLNPTGTTIEALQVVVEKVCATPTDTPTGNGGTPPTFAGSSTEAPKPPTCTVGFEKARVWYSGNQFSWATDAKNIQKFSIIYGRTADSLIYGVDNLPADARSIEVNGRDGWNQTWFQVWTWVEGCAEKSDVIDP